MVPSAILNTMSKPALPVILNACPLLDLSSAIQNSMNYITGKCKRLSTSGFVYIHITVSVNTHPLLNLHLSTSHVITESQNAYSSYGPVYNMDVVFYPLQLSQN